jgi:hypothetical protein
MRGFTCFKYQCKMELMATMAFFECADCHRLTLLSFDEPRQCAFCKSGDIKSKLIDERTRFLLEEVFFSPDIGPDRKLQ